jgi:peptidoglycan-N-acetylglucosamine deacetylase
MQNLFLLLFYGLTFYAFLPGLISRMFGFRAFKRGRVKREIALTFDDGPDPHYTLQLLDLLKHYNAKATFFVVGAHAEKHPELLKRMHDEGHVIGIHNYEHKTNWFMRPKKVKWHIQRTQEIIKEAIGQDAVYYRPPWGIVNAFDYSPGHLQIILWSAIFGDWRYKLGADRLRQRMMKKMRPGEVLLLHDCGMTPGADEHAPENMIQALEAYLAEAVQRGFTFVGIDEMIALTDKAVGLVPSRFKRILIWLWLQWEGLFHRMFRTKPVGSPSPSFHYRMVKYHGASIDIGSGKTLNNGDPIVELHFDNKLLFEIAHKSATPIAAAIRLVHMVEKQLPALATVLSRDEEAAKAKSLYGVTMIHRGASKLGFGIHELPAGMFASMSKIYLKVLMRVLTPTPKHSESNKRSSRHAVELKPHIVTYPISELLLLASSEAAAAAEHKSVGVNKPRPMKQGAVHSSQELELDFEQLDGSAADKARG